MFLSGETLEFRVFFTKHMHPASCKGAKGKGSSQPGVPGEDLGFSVSYNPRNSKPEHRHPSPSAQTKVLLFHPFSVESIQGSLPGLWRVLGPILCKGEQQTRCAKSLPTARWSKTYCTVFQRC